MSSISEEMQTFTTFTFSERRSICLLLDFAKPEARFNIKFFHYWSARGDAPANAWTDGILLAARDRLAHTSRIKAILVSKAWGSDYEFHSEALRTAVLITSNGYLRRFEPFYFLFMRLFGVAAHDYIPSIYAAAMLHHDTKSRNNEDEEVLAAMRYRDSGWEAQAPMFYPEWTDR